LDQKSQMLRISTSRGSLRPMRGRMLLRLPVLTSKWSEWELAVREIIRDKIAGDGSGGSHDDADLLTRHKIQQRFSADIQELILTALGMQVELYCAKASEELGFDIGLAAHHVVTDRADHSALIFATINTAARDRMLSTDDVERRFSNLSKARRELYQFRGRRIHVPKADVYGDLLLCASVRTADTVGKMSPKELIGQVVENHLETVGASDLLSCLRCNMTISGPH
jgi:hypothetical protein